MTTLPPFTANLPHGILFEDMVTDYPEPVNRLITWGVLTAGKQAWPDYMSAVGLSTQHIPDLIRMALDTRFDNEGKDWPDERPYWAPNHAVRALGQLRATVAVKPLLPLLGKDDDWMMGDIPNAYTLMGPAVIPEIIQALGDEETAQRVREGAAETLEKWGSNTRKPVQCV